VKRILWLVALVAAQCCSGQNCTQTVPLTVLDSGTGLAIPNLPAEVLQARLGKDAVPVIGIKQTRTRRLLILVDQSGSITKAPTDSTFSHERKATDVTLRVLDELMGELPADLSVEYALFDDQWVFGDAFSSDSKAVRKSMVEVGAKFEKTGKGKTAIFDALHEGLMRFQTIQPGDAILLFTDGQDNRSKRSEKQLETELRASGVRLFTILLAGHTFAPEERLSQDTLVVLTKRSGGVVRVLDATNTGWGFDKLSQAAAQDLRRFWKEEVLTGYLLQVQVPANFNKERKWTLAINPAADPRFKSAVVSYPDRLLPCPAITATTR